MIRRGGFFSFTAVVLAGLFVLVLPDLKSKAAAQRADKSVCMVVDWEDLVSFDVSLNELPARAVLMSATRASAADETSVRKSGLNILWRLDSDVNPRLFLSRFQTGDGIFVADEHALEHPALFRDLPEKLESMHGFLILMEFVPNKLLPLLAKRVPDHLIKAHLLSTREMLFPKPGFWAARLRRAVDDRWVRLIVLRFSPAWTGPQNIEFQRRVVSDFRARGYTVEGPQPFNVWKPAHVFRFWLALVFLLSVLVPFVSFAWALDSRVSPMVTFLLASAMSLLAGLVIHGLGSFPQAVLGLAPVRGVKLQLVLPLAFSFFLFFPKAGLRSFLDMPVRVRHFVFAAFFIVVVAGVYLMRSGNFPLLPVSDAERGFRDALEKILVARPRFKEFLIGHPLFLMGLALRRRRIVNEMISGFVVWLGLVGQISILNTFTHFHSPVDAGVVRTLNGIWLGTLMAAPGLLLLHFKK